MYPILWVQHYSLYFDQLTIIFFLILQSVSMFLCPTRKSPRSKGPFYGKIRRSIRGRKLHDEKTSSFESSEDSNDEEANKEGVSEEDFSEEWCCGLAWLVLAHATLCFSFYSGVFIDCKNLWVVIVLVLRDLILILRVSAYTFSAWSLICPSFDLVIPDLH